MGMKYYIDINGNYLGGTDGDPLSANEVPSAPDNANKIWNGLSWEFPISALDEMRILDIKAEADKRIIALDDSWTVKNHDQKQRNDLMAGLGILLNIAKAFNSGVQADIDTVIAEGDAAMVKAVKIELIRTMSNNAEANGDTVEQFIIDLDLAL